MKRLTSIVALLVLTLSALPVYAQAVPDAPDQINWEDTSTTALGFQNVLETGDFLVLAQYNVAYTTLPTNTIDVNYIFQLKDSGGTILKTTAPYPYNDGGYGKGVVSVYMTAAEVTAASLGAWPYTGTTIELFGNPTIFTTVPTTGALSLVSTNFTAAGADQASNRDSLKTKMLQDAADLQASWAVAMLTDNGLLNSTDGSPYFVLAMPNARLMAPDAFSVATEAPVFPTPVPTPGSAGTLAGQSETRFDGTFWLNPALDSTATTLGLPAGAFAGFLVLVLIVLLTVIGLRVGGSGGGLVGFGIGIVVVLPAVGIYGGFIDVAWGLLAVALVGAVAVLKLAREWVQ